MRQGVPTREQLLDLVFEIRPVFTGPVPPGLESLVPLQDQVVAAPPRTSASCCRRSAAEWRRPAVGDGPTMAWRRGHASV